MQTASHKNIKLKWIWFPVNGFETFIEGLAGRLSRSTSDRTTESVA